MTYTFVLVEVSKKTYDEVRAKLIAGGASDALHKDSDGKEVLNMHGLALIKENK